MEDTVKKVYKELLSINRKGVFDNTAAIEPYDPDKPLILKVLLTPDQGVYSGGTIEFKMVLPDGYPDTGTPTISCKNKIYHPNINNHTICFSMLTEKNRYSIEQYINGLLWLLYNPNLESRLNSNVTTDRALFEKYALLAMMGESVEGVKYEKILNKITPNQENTFLILKLLNGKHEGKICSFKMEDVIKEFKLVGSQKFITASEKLAMLSSESMFYLFSARNGHTVPKRAKSFGVEESFIVKEMIVTIGDEIGLVVTNSDKKLDLDSLSRIFEKKVQICKSKEASKHNISVKQANIFDKENLKNVYINYELFQQEYVYTAGEIKNCIVRIKPQEILKIRPDAIVLHGITTPLNLQLKEDSLSHSLKERLQIEEINLVQANLVSESG